MAYSPESFETSLKIFNLLLKLEQRLKADLYLILFYLIEKVYFQNEKYFSFPYSKFYCLESTASLTALFLLLAICN